MKLTVVQLASLLALLLPLIAIPLPKEAGGTWDVNATGDMLLLVLGVSAMAGGLAAVGPSALFRNLATLVRESPALGFLAAFLGWSLLSGALSPAPFANILLNGTLGHSPLWKALGVAAALLSRAACRTPGGCLGIYRGFRLGGILLVLGTIYEALSGDALYLLGSGGHAYPTMRFPQHGYLAGYLALLAVLAVGYRDALLGALTSFALGLLPTRGALLAALAGYALASAGDRKRTWVALLSLLALGAGTLLPRGEQAPQGVERYHRVGSLETRLLYWQMGLASWRERPLLGWGGYVGDWAWLWLAPPELFLEAIRKEMGLSPDEPLVFCHPLPGWEGILVASPVRGYGPEEGDADPEEAGIVFGPVKVFLYHNEYLQFLASWGILGLLLYGGALLAAVRAGLPDPHVPALLATGLYLVTWPATVPLEGALMLLVGMAGCGPPPSSPSLNGKGNEGREMERRKGGGLLP